VKNAPAYRSNDANIKSILCLCHVYYLREANTWALIIITKFSAVYNYNTKRYSIMTVYTERSYAECDADYRYTVAFNDPLKENV
jgi:hypothetical protein